MISDYSSLKTTIASFIHRSDLAALIPDFIAAAESRIYTEMRVRAMETAYSATMSSGTVAVPTGLLEWKWLYINTNPLRKLERKDVEWIVSQFPASLGKPYYFARNGSNLVFGPTPDADYALVGSYYKRLTSLSDTNTTNWLTDDQPELIKCASLVEASQYANNDAGMSLWEGKYQQVKNLIEQSEKREKFSGSRLTAARG